MRLTVSCADCDELPKVRDAGQIVDCAGTTVQVMHNGVVVEAGGYFGDWMTEIIRCLGGHHEPQEELAFATVLDRLKRAPGPLTAVELGSFWAYYSLWFLAEHPDGRVVALEPDPANLELGRRNFALNGRSGTFVHGVVGPNAGTSRDFSNLDGTTSQVREYDLPSLLVETSVDRIDLLLCDVQGGEHDVLAPAAGLIAENRLRFAVISTHHHSISGDALTHQRVLEQARALGGTVVVEHTVGESCSGDGLIVVSFDARDRDLRVETSRVRQGDSLFGALEHDLARAQAAMAATAQDLDRLRAEAGERSRRYDALEQRVAQLTEERGVALAELERLRSTKLLRWSEPLRASYASLRSVAGLSSGARTRRACTCPRRDS